MRLNRNIWIKAIFLCILSGLLFFRPNLTCAKENRNPHKSNKKNPGQNIKIIPIGSIELFGSYSDIKDGSDLWGYFISGTFSPVIQLNKKTDIIPLYYGVIKRMRQFVTQEEGGRLYNTWQIHNLSMALRKNVSDRFGYRLEIFGALNYLKETRDESFGKGLYDYWDLGLSLNLTNRILSATKEKSLFLSSNLQYFRREYPNYKSLISLAPVTAPEKNEKDFDGIRLSFQIEQNKEDGSYLKLNSSLLTKFFIDKRLIGEDGILIMNKKRRDYVFETDIDIRHIIAKRWTLGFDNSIVYNHSNLGFYDSRDTVLPGQLGDDVFTKNYYTYTSITIHPYIIYSYPINNTKKISIRLGYTYLVRDYTDRKAQLSDGTYTDTDQRDTEQTFHIGLTYPLTRQLSLITSFDYTIADSNQKYEKYYRYSYDVYQMMSGLSFSF